MQFQPHMLLYYLLFYPKTSNSYLTGNIDFKIMLNFMRMAASKALPPSIIVNKLRTPNEFPNIVSMTSHHPTAASLNDRCCTENRVMSGQHKQTGDSERATTTALRAVLEHASLMQFPTSCHDQRCARISLLILLLLARARDTLYSKYGGLSDKRYPPDTDNQSPVQMIGRLGTQVNTVEYCEALLQTSLDLLHPLSYFPLQQCLSLCVNQTHLLQQLI